MRASIVALCVACIAGCGAGSFPPDENDPAARPKRQAPPFVDTGAARPGTEDKPEVLPDQEPSSNPPERTKEPVIVVPPAPPPPPRSEP